jgi:hypothetical protein
VYVASKQVRVFCLYAFEGLMGINFDLFEQFTIKGKKPFCRLLKSAVNCQHASSITFFGMLAGTQHQHF